MGDVTILLAFGAGVLSFVSPCNLPLYPAFISYITGVSVDELKREDKKLPPSAIIHTIFFLLGFSIIFVVLGMSTSFIGSLFMQYNDFIRQMGAIFIILFGLVILGIFQPSFLMKNKQLKFKKKPSGYVGTSFIGMGFAAGWTPCIGPILAGVMALSLTNPGSGMMYMAIYSLGFSIPFLLMTFFIGKLNIIRKYSYQITKIGGSVMVIMGVFLFFDWMTQITSFLVNHVFGGFTGF
ncbi:cytochrome c biogenesis CcdA family protein [Thalassorhabdus alkalitolerans]|uniref:Cytochrome c biogenesis CcdA family protein n=1 Tax=Thalassorhabdus alkalitolerans TaxID=2282697 RepID=A0ABW0YND2_9BACI|nr:MULTISPECIES: cytochrome c biogenesis protein CcdA [Bacillaceae]